MFVSIRKSELAIAFLVLTAAAIGGCKSAPKAAPKSGADAKSGAAVQQPAKKTDVALPSSGSIHLDDKITKLCGDLPEAHFAFDSASVGPTAGGMLDPLARCFVSGPGKGKGLRLVGHADARGETEYNFALGLKRAASVSRYLGEKGMEKGRLDTTSKGELDATGTDEAGWARDRKVEIFLSE